MNEICEWWMKPRRLHGWNHATSPDNPSALGWDVGYEAGAASEFAEQIWSCLCKCQDVTKLWILAHYFSDCLINASVNRTPTGWSKLTSHCFNNDEANPARSAKQFIKHLDACSVVILTFWILRPKNAAVLYGLQIAASGGERSISLMQFFESVWTRFTYISLVSVRPRPGVSSDSFLWMEVTLERILWILSSLCKKSDSVPNEANKFDLIWSDLLQVPIIGYEAVSCS